MPPFLQVESGSDSWKAIHGLESFRFRVHPTMSCCLTGKLVSQNSYEQRGIRPGIVARAEVGGLGTQSRIGAYDLGREVLFF